MTRGRLARPAHAHQKDGEPMRIVVGVDGSAGSHAAAALVAAMTWPTATTVHLVSILDPGTWIPPGPGVPSPAGLVGEREVTAYLKAEQRALRAEFTETELATERSVVTGRPGEALVDEAARLDADLVVVGSRGHGQIAALLLGSVSAEVVDRAPCPVLVARRGALNRAILASDGSLSARSAAQLTGSWPAFSGVPIDVVVVAEAVRPWTVGISPAFVPNAMAAYSREVREATAEAQQIADEATAGLRQAGRRATAVVRRGQAAAAIVGAAEEREADMVVIGCRGRSGLTRLMLGSVARDVLLASSASVLTVRETAGS
jgi:nucleotide-binding universal stress UspA family protein